MADSTDDIVIRPFDARKDLKEVQMLIGMSSMEQLAVANRLAYIHPVAISVWLVCASTIIQVFRAWPDGSGANGWLGYLAPLPILACTALPVLFGIDWLHRPIFEDMLKANVESFTKAIAIRDSKGSSNEPFQLVMEYKKAPIGYAFVHPVTSANQKPTYRLTHFHVDAPYRPAGVGNDLLSHVVKILQKTKGEIVGVTTRLTPYTVECLKSAGFTPNERGREIWDLGKTQGNGEKIETDLAGKRVLLVDTRRTGWVFSAT